MKSHPTLPLHSRPSRVSLPPTRWARSFAASRRNRRGKGLMTCFSYFRDLGGGGGAMAALLLLLLPVFSPSLFSPLGRASPSIFSEWNAPKPRHRTLLEGALQRQTSDELSSSLWTPLTSQGWKPCIISPITQCEYNASRKLQRTKSFRYLSMDPLYSWFITDHLFLIKALPRNSRGYIQVFLDGGLNQQRMGICDAVAVAKILNATLVIPHLEVNPVWQDSSSFSEIFDVDHFVDVLKDDIKIVQELPPEYTWSTREYYALGIRATRVKTAPAHASAKWYMENVIPVLQSYGIAAISPFSHRLAFDDMPEDVQRLRCKVNFEALDFVHHIKLVGDILVKRLRNPLLINFGEKEYLRGSFDESYSNGKFVALHLRFDKDMAAHSACDFGGGIAEKRALAKYRQVLWQGRVLKSKFTDKELRSQGRCPLTPEEIGLLLAALGFDQNTRLFLASHKVQYAVHLTRFLS